MDLVRPRLGVGCLHIPRTSVVKYAAVQQAERWVGAAAPPVLSHKPPIGERNLGVLVDVAQPRVAGCGIQIEVVFLYVLAPVALVARQAEGALFQDGVAAVPQGQCEAEPLLLVADAAQAVLAPAVGSRAGLIVAEVFPGGTVRAVVL